MAMFLIAGNFRVTGAQPDGDSIRFTPDDPQSGIELPARESNAMPAVPRN